MRCNMSATRFWFSLMAWCSYTPYRDFIPSDGIIFSSDRIFFSSDGILFLSNGMDKELPAAGNTFESLKISALKVMRIIAPFWAFKYTKYMFLQTIFLFLTFFKHKIVLLSCFLFNFAPSFRKIVQLNNV